jgi:hypothetical protein
MMPAKSSFDEITGHRYCEPSDYKPCYRPEFFKSNLIGSDFIRSIFTCIQCSAIEVPKLRIDIDGKPRPDLLPTLLRSSIRQDQSISDWLVMALGSDNYCIALDGLTKWSDDFHKEMHTKFVEPVILTAGEPFLGGTFYAFLGRYGYTPTGIHKDDEHTFLIHFGPGTKDAWVWPNGSLPNKVGVVEESFQVDTIEPKAAYYSLQAGDLLYIPPRSFHLLKAPEYSVTVGFTLFSASKTKVLVRSLYEEGEEDEDEDVISCFWPRLGSEVEQCQQNLTDVFHTTMPEIGDKVVSGLIRERHRLKSNGFITAKPIRVAVSASDLTRLKFVVPKWIKFSYWVTNAEVEIFVRGRIVSIESTPGVLDCLAFVSKKESFLYEEFCCSCRGKMPREMIDEILRIFVELRVLEAR